MKSNRKRVIAAYKKLSEIDTVRYTEAFVAQNIKATGRCSESQLGYFAISLEGLIERKLKRRKLK